MIKHFFFLYLRDNVGCQLLKRTVKTGAALVENAGHINNESQLGGGGGAITGGDDPRRSNRRVSNTCEYSRAATSQRQERGATRRRETGSGIEAKKQGQKSQESNSHSRMQSELSVVMVTFAVCQ